MARKKSLKKKKTRGRAGGFSPVKVFSARPVLIFLLCAGLFAGAFYGIRYFFLNSTFFTIKEVVVNSPSAYSFREGEKKLKRLYAGRNIFTVDLKQVQTLIKNDFPQLKKVEVRRNLPEILEIDVVSRGPVAVIDTGGGIVIDAEGVVLSVGEKSRELVRIKGISFFLHTPSRGNRISDRALGRALSLLDGLRSRMPRNMKDVEYIDISGRNNILLGISGVTVKMGTDDFSRKIDELKEILNDPNMDVRDINYIDLRFRDPVISLK